ncbi:unnamed protein product [Calypogeia fissa]
MPMGTFAMSRSCCSWSTLCIPSSSVVAAAAPAGFRETLDSSYSSVGELFCGRICSENKQQLERKVPHYWCRKGGGGSSQLVVRASAQNRNVDDIGNTVRALQSRNRFPKKYLGQHYMVNETVNTRIVEAAQIQPDDLVLEIGPGTGSLTQALVDAGAHVIAVEKDPDMASLVMERFRHSNRVEVVQLDFLKWKVGSTMRKRLGQETLNSQQPKLAKVVSNLPFNITTHVLKRVLPMGDVFSRVVLLLQDEAALRLTDAAPAPVDYRPMTILVNFFSVPQYKFKVPRKAFFPQPRVDGGVISFDLKTPSEYPPVGSPKIFMTMINAAFNGKRKMLRNSLQHMFKAADIQVALLSSGFSDTARPEELSLTDFVAFYNTVSSLSPSALASKPTVDEFVKL